MKQEREREREKSFQSQRGDEHRVSSDCGDRQIHEEKQRTESRQQARRIETESTVRRGEYVDVRKMERRKYPYAAVAALIPCRSFCQLPELCVVTVRTVSRPTEILAGTCADGRERECEWVGEKSEFSPPYRLMIDPE